MLDFPSSPVDNQTFIAATGITYQYQTPPGIWTTAPADASVFVAYPEEFGAVGTGTDNDGPAITNWLAYCTANNVKAVGTPGKKYRVDNYSIFIRTPFDGNGCEFWSTNNSQGYGLFVIESLAADIETVTIATANTWTRMYRGSRKIPQLANQMGWCYSFRAAEKDQPFLKRSTGTVDFPGIAKGEGFEVVTNEGDLSKALTTDFATFVNIAPTSFFGQRRFIRPRMVVENLIIRLTSAGSATSWRTQMLVVQRPHTTLRDCELYNDTGTDCAQGYVGNYATNILFERCSVENLSPLKFNPNDGTRLTTCYGFNTSYSDDITFRDCSTKNCRRGIDSHGSTNYTVDGGMLPDGIGGHWITGLHIYGRPWISSQHPDNLGAISIAGGDVNIESANIYLSQEKLAVLRMRPDYPEFRGMCRIGRGVDITIDDTSSSSPTWVNSTAYVVGGTAYDPVDVSNWRVLVAHTSAAAGSFTADRTAHPTYWAPNTNATRPDWKNSTVYTAGPPAGPHNEVYDPVTPGIYRVMVSHTSPASPTTFAAARTANPTYWVRIPKGITIIDFPSDQYNSGRGVYRPSTIDCMPGLIRQVNSGGAPSPYTITLVGFDPLTAAQFPQGVIMPKQINVDPGALDLAGGYSVPDGTSRIYCSFRKPDQGLGDTCRVKISGVPNMSVLCSVASASPYAPTQGRFDLDIRGITEVTTNAQIGAPCGAVRRIFLSDVNPGILINYATSMDPIGDEVFVWEPIDSGSYSPSVIAVTNVTGFPVGSSCHWAYSRKGSVITAEVFGNLSLTPTATATLTKVQIELPPGSPGTSPGFTAVSQLVGHASLTTGAAIGAIVADPATERAELAFTSVGIGAHTMYFQFSYWFVIS